MPDRNDPNPRAEVVSTECYELMGVTIVPHYRLNGIYVLPGGECITEYRLKGMGAKKTRAMLWPRNWV